MREKILVTSDDRILIDDHVLITEPEIAWQCVKERCGFVVESHMKGHRCMFRDEMYTDKPNTRFVLTNKTVDEMYPEE